MAPPAYTGDGNGFYGDEKAKLKKTYQTQERNVAAWQVIPPSLHVPGNPLSLPLFVCLLMR